MIFPLPNTPAHVSQLEKTTHTGANKPTFSAVHWVPPRWRKVLADIWGNRMRSLLVILSIAIGVFAVGFVSTTFVILTNDMQTDYLAANPHGAIIFSEPFDEELLSTARRVPGIEQAEGRSSVSARLLAGEGKKIFISIVGVDNTQNMLVDRLRPNTPDENLVIQNNEILIEKSVLSDFPIKTGDTLTIETSDRHTRSLRVAGIVHDVTAIPYIFTNQASGFVTPKTIEWLGGTRDYNQLYLTVTENKKDETHVRTLAKQVSDKIEKGGQLVYSTNVVMPGRHFATVFIESLGLIMGILGFLSVFLSAFLVINTINALLSQHIRQIGMMKSIGAQQPQLIGMYSALVACFGLIALAIAGLPSILAGCYVSGGIGDLLNFKVFGFRVPYESVLLQLAVAIFIPLGAAYIPVLSGTRLTICDAISSYGIASAKNGRQLVERTLEKIRGMPRPLLLSLRNTFRRKVRLFLTLSTLTLGGAIFIAIFNLWASIDITMVETYRYLLADINITFSRPYRTQEMKSIIESTPGVVSAEGWGLGSVQLLSLDKASSVELLMLAPPRDSKLIDPTMKAGRWLLPDDENAMVIGNDLLVKRPDLKVGDSVTIEIMGNEYIWHIVGIYKIVGDPQPPLVYANQKYLSNLLNDANRTANIRVVTEAHDLESQQRVIKAIEERFKLAQIQVVQMISGAEMKASTDTGTDVMVYFLMIMALMIAFVGALGLSGAMSMNVMERTREIGIMRAIGAVDAAILQMVIFEGMVIGLISWFFGSILATPITILLDDVVGSKIIGGGSSLQLIFSPDGYLLWLAGVLVLSAAASALPARSASRLTIREVLAYE